MSKRKRQPKSPQDIALEKAARIADEAQRQADESRLALPANEAVVASRDIAGRVVRTRREDVFDHLYHSKALDSAGYNAVKRLEHDMAVSCGAADAPVSSGAGGPSGPLDVPTFLIVRIAASDRIRAVMAVMGTKDFALLHSLLAPALEGRVDPWRAKVFMLTGEGNDRVQTAIVRQAVKSLVSTYETLDYRRDAA